MRRAAAALISLSICLSAPDVFAQRRGFWPVGGAPGAAHDPSLDLRLNDGVMLYFGAGAVLSSTGTAGEIRFTNTLIPDSVIFYSLDGIELRIYKGDKTALGIIRAAAFTANDGFDNRAQLHGGGTVSSITTPNDSGIGISDGGGLAWANSNFPSSTSTANYDIGFERLAAGVLGVTTGHGGEAKGLRMPRIINSAPAEPIACNAAGVGTEAYVDDDDDGAGAEICECMAIDSTPTYDWVKDTVAYTACSFF